MHQRTVVILGGHGTFGRHITEQLAAHPGTRVVIAGRHAERGLPVAEAMGVAFRTCDAHQPASLQQAVADAWLVINASGPFQAGDYAIPRTCIQAGCHYVDLADGRQYVADFVQLDQAARDRSVFACTGASTTPAITSALIADLLPTLGRIVSIRIALNAGNKNRAGVSTVATILSYVGRPVRVWQDGGWKTLRGWSGGEFIDFPPPVGRRRVQLCDVPDLELFPKHFGADQVVFKAGVELTVLNYAILALSGIKRVCPPLNLPSLARPLVAMSGLFKRFGTLHGSCAVWLTDSDGRQKSIALVAHENGPRIPGSPAILLARKLLAEDGGSAGAVPCLGLLPLAAFAEFLAPYRIEVVRGEHGKWHV
ncbi:MAG: saccharopine dehydrogenase NADP-binding domain-containing protein [Pirellulaceae bacterium]|nr:saccharopine dehydrogenase NADP-binding domain-containing protein [Pirellulaceae bacterium]